METFITLMTAAFGMVAALAWNTAISEVIRQYYCPENQVIPLLIYAVVVTVVAVICIVIIARSLGKLKDSIEEEERKKEQSAKQT